MYLSHDRLEIEPFSISPDPRFLTLSEAARRSDTPSLKNLYEMLGICDHPCCR
jgi:hypothetical protein